MYNRDKTILYYSSLQQIDFIRNLNIHYSTFQKHLKNKTYYLDKYIFTRELIKTAKISYMSIFNLALLLEKDRVKYNKNKPIISHSRTIMLTSINNQNDIMLFYGVRPCINFLNNTKGLASTRETLLKYIIKGKPYHGYICKFV